MNITLTFKAADEKIGLTHAELMRALVITHTAMLSHGIEVAKPAPIAALAQGKMITGTLKGNVLLYRRSNMVTTDDAVSITRGSLTARFALLDGVNSLCEHV